MTSCSIRKQENSPVSHSSLMIPRKFFIRKQSAKADNAQECGTHQREENGDESQVLPKVLAITIARLHYTADCDP